MHLKRHPIGTIIIDIDNRHIIQSTGFPFITKSEAGGYSNGNNLSDNTKALSNASYDNQWQPVGPHTDRHSKQAHQCIEDTVEAKDRCPISINICFASPAGVIEVLITGIKRIFCIIVKLESLIPHLPVENAKCKGE